jgi:hypothetical protein
MSYNKSDVKALPFLGEINNYKEMDFLELYMEREKLRSLTSKASWCCMTSYLSLRRTFQECDAEYQKRGGDSALETIYEDAMKKIRYDTDKLAKETRVIVTTAQSA